MELSGRLREQKVFEEAAASTQSALIAVYGRRRIGKTFLIRKYFEPLLILDHTGLHNGELPDQLEHFRNTLLKSGYKEAISTPPDWLSAFSMLENYINSLKGKKKKAIFLDELPWMDTPRSKFLMAFENFWNSFCAKRQDLIVIVCGSAASWMIKKIVHNKGGLYNRLTHIVHLHPFDLYETEQYLRQKGIVWSRYDIVQCYMMMGGIPYYLSQVRKGEGVMQFVDRVCFAADGILQNEYALLFGSLFANSERHYKIVESLATTRMGIVRDVLLTRSGLPSGGTFTHTLDELLASGFVEKTVPVGKKSQGALYRLADAFLLFYFKFMQQPKGKKQHNWQATALSPTWHAWSGLAYEQVCRQHIPHLLHALQLGAMHTQQSAWQGSGSQGSVQIDLLIERADRVLQVCEIKFARAGYSIDKKYAEELREKMHLLSQQPFAKKQTLLLTMITTFGLQPNAYSQELVQTSLTMDDLFYPLKK